VLTNQEWGHIFKIPGPVSRHFLECHVSVTFSLPELN
jgi:hypothetical protein